ncbi:TPA: hypothetical protein N0F65_009851 [Lagenidium giganteum]|uniref:NadR/Ttd14 AAA domain-containing protein n=1 Tax=Lagenidium giganteum TaxID=4803 RepID=A0AAV2YPF1_9STRA|nr:TPA: hypothetical protein N0F65_009851 [Lagenidium giganteum]
MPEDSKLLIVSLEGCHGCGKTALCEEFEQQGYRVLDEAFMDMPSYALHPQSLLMETSWVCSWFERVLRLASRLSHEKNPKYRKQVYIADRSPFSAVFYSANGHLLEPVIREQMREVQAYSNVQFYTANIQVDPELLWERILARLEREPERCRFNEHKRSWMEQTLAFYNNFQWDLNVTNDHRSISLIVSNIIATLAERDVDFREVSERNQLMLKCSSSFASTDSDDCESTDELVSPAHRSIIAFNNCQEDDTDSDRS